MATGESETHEDQDEADRRHRIQLRLRKRVAGTAERPRLACSAARRTSTRRSIDDLRPDARWPRRRASSRREGQLQRQAPRGSNTAGAAAVGKMIAERLLEKGIKRVVFDRGGFLYHGRVRAVAEAAREAGLEF